MRSRRGHRDAAHRSVADLLLGSDARDGGLGQVDETGRTDRSLPPPAPAAAVASSAMADVVRTGGTLARASPRPKQVAGGQLAWLAARRERSRRAA